MATKVLTPPLPLYRLDVETYNRMVESGALEGKPIELLEGLLVDMSPEGPDHASVIMRLTRHMAGAEAWLCVQLPLEVPPSSVPEPDIALVEEGEVEARPGHPRSALLAVEVAVTRRHIARGVKARLYAQAGIPVYWIVDVPRKIVEVHTDPGPEGYRRCDTYGVGSQIPSPAAGVADLDVGWLLERVVG